MRVTRLAVFAGIAVLGFLCWLAAIGFTVVIAPLVTIAVLVVLVAGGNWLGDRRVPQGEPRRIGRPNAEVDPGTPGAPGDVSGADRR